MNTGLEKLIGVSLCLIFMNLGFILFAREVYSQIPTFIPILLFNLFISIDVGIRPRSMKKDESNRALAGGAFLSMPLVLLLPYLEYKVVTAHILSPLMVNWLSISGTVLLGVGGGCLLLSRIQIGKYGGPKIVIEETHQLVTRGMYRYIRHPIYLGFLGLFGGFSLAFGSFLMTFGICFILFLVFRGRIELEEKLLISTFGEEYLQYKKRTK
ncbi:MAG: methyltransferase family protein, partial [Candidatus Hodarchaeota archaeon]